MKSALLLSIILTTISTHAFSHINNLHPPGFHKMTPPSDPTPSTIPHPFGTPNRYTTTHNPQGKAVFVPSTPSHSSSLTPYNSIGMVVFDAYKTFTQPLNMTAEADILAITANANRTAPNPGVWFPAPGESLVRYCDWAPGATLEFHRTETIDFGIVMHGEMEMMLDSGEKRLLKVGDTLVQRGTLHAWRNPSETVWARVVFFLLGTPPVVVGGEEKGEVLPWKEGGEEGKE